MTPGSLRVARALARAGERLAYEVGVKRAGAVRAEIDPKDQPPQVRGDAERLRELWVEEIRRGGR